MSQTVELNTRGLDQLIKSMKRLPSARVGVLGTKTNRSDGGRQTNASIGAAHEFGTSKLPQRSFLRVPIMERLEGEMEKAGAFGKGVLKEVIQSGSVLPWMKKVTALAESIVIGAFDTGGYGKWRPWKNPNYKNNAMQILVDTQQLRNSITSECE